MHFNYIRQIVRLLIFFTAAIHLFPISFCNFGTQNECQRTAHARGKDIHSHRPEIVLRISGFHRQHRQSHFRGMAVTLSGGKPTECWMYSEKCGKPTESWMYSGRQALKKHPSSWTPATVIVHMTGKWGPCIRQVWITKKTYTRYKLLGGHVSYTCSQKRKGAVLFVSHAVFFYQYLTSVSSIRPRLVPIYKVYLIT